jgi:hypothetical protein
MTSMAPIKREYNARDMQDWNDYYNQLPLSNGRPYTRKCNLNFASVFPIRTVLACRVALVNMETSDAICEWFYIFPVAFSHLIFVILLGINQLKRHGRMTLISQTPKTS